MTLKPIISFPDFAKDDLRQGTVTKAANFPEAHRPAIKLWIDLGDQGIKQSSAQITDFYTPEKLVGRQVIVVVNLPPKQVGKFISEVLTLGVITLEDKVVLIGPDSNSQNGCQIL